MKAFIRILVLILISPLSLAQEAPQNGEAGGQSGKGEVKNAWGFGVGLGVEQFGDEYVKSASLQGSDRIVTLEKTYKTQPSAWLTGTWNIFPLSPWVDAEGGLIRQTSWGLFAGIKLIGSEGDAFSAFALGPQVNFDLPKDRSVSVGVGWVTHQTRKLARGIAEGQALPSHYDGIVYREGTENSYMLMISYGL